jgi:hypothetical protein
MLIRKVEEIKDIVNSETILDTLTSRTILDKVTKITFDKDYLEYLIEQKVDEVLYQSDNIMDLIHLLCKDSLFKQECGKELIDTLYKCQYENDLKALTFKELHELYDFVIMQVSKKKIIYPTIEDQTEQTNFEKGKVLLSDYVLLKDTLQKILINKCRGL